jgi:long-subunit fatty acid transport protein
LSLHARGEYGSVDAPVGPFVGNIDGYEFTLTAQYDLWENVISRAELRWDHSETPVFGQPTNPQKNAVMLAANIIYKF